jgi:hypothetical protein
MERRWGNRLVLDETVRVTREREDVGIARLHEVSLSGGFIYTRRRIPAMTRLQLELPEGGSQSERTIEAFVVRVCEDGVGLEWCEFAPPGVVQLMVTRQRRFPPVRVTEEIQERRRRLP